MLVKQWTPCLQMFPMYHVTTTWQQVVPKLNGKGRDLLQVMAFTFHTVLHLSDTSCCVISCVHPVIQPLSIPPSIQVSCLCGKSFKVGHYKQTWQPSTLIPAMLMDTIDLYCFDSTFSDLDVDWGLQGQWKAKLVGFIFVHTFQLLLFL